MSIIAKLHVDEKSFTILNFRYSIEQNSDYSGYPSAKPTGGLWSIVIESTKEHLFYEWMVAENSMKNLEIVLSPSSMNGKTRTIKLFDVYCLKYMENFDGVNSKPMSTYIEVSPAIMQDGGTNIFEKYWKVSNLSNTAAATTINDGESKIVDAYYTDLDGNEDTELTIGDQVFLVIKTENMIGEIRDINLNSHQKDFEYKGQILEDDILSDFIINSDLQKIKLKIVAPQDKPIAIQK